MSDSFADLWNTSAPLPAKPKPQTLSAAAAASPGGIQRTTTAKKADVFSFLAAPSSSSSSSSPSPSVSNNTLTLNSGTLSRPITPSTILRSHGDTQFKRKDNGDAFADLFSGSTAAVTTTSTTSTKSGHAGMTLAARLAMEAEENNKRYRTTALDVPSHEAWAGLDSLEGGISHLGTNVNGTGSKGAKVKVDDDDDDDDWGLRDFGSTAAPATRPSTFVQNIINTHQKPTSTPFNSTSTLWDLDGFGSSTGSTTTTTTTTTTITPLHPTSSSTSYLKPQSRPQSRSTSILSYPSSSQTPINQKVDSPDMDFDFGSREDQDQDQDIGRGEPIGTRTSGTAGDLLLLDDDDDDNDHNGLMGGMGNRGFPRGNEFLDDVDDIVRSGTTARHDEDEEEDILGVLSKPVEVVIAQKNSDLGSSRTLSRHTPPPPPPSLGQGSSTPTSGPPSPPPHILGQIVEMGFSVSQAKKALAATADGKDVQAALEGLLNSGGGSDINEPSPTLSSTQAVQARPTPHHPNVRGLPKGQRERERERKERESQRTTTRREDTSSITGSGSTTTAADIQDQADKLLSQASEIGLSVLSRASAFWKEGKEKVKVIMEERSGGGGFEERGKSRGGGRLGGRGGGGALDGRPKWMKEVVHPENGDEFREERVGGFKDAVSPGFQERDEVGGRSHVEPTGEPEVDLFSSDPIPAAAARSSVSVSQQRPSKAPTRTRTHSHPTHRPPPRSRTLPTTSSSTLSLASTHKNTGTSQFKLGQYGTASESYTSAITLLPPGHLLLVPLYTNRSLARLRCGEYVGAGEDAGEALKVICVFDFDLNVNASNGNVIWNPETELPELIQGGRERINEGGWSDSRGVGVDLVDGYVKALKRRAEAWEGREKWIEAGKDWEILAGGGGWIGEGLKKEAVRGAGRCRRMVSANGQEGVGSSSSSSVLNPPLPKPKPKLSPRPPPSSIPSQPSKALLAHQATTLQAEADDTLKHQLKDSVDARISAWKNGKETNIRALLASLDMVLWDEILTKGGGSVKVNGLGELVTDVQVKKGYVRAIARVHPDKLNTSNSTVEQRMLANSVFAALNEAWIAFQGGK